MHTEFHGADSYWRFAPGSCTSAKALPCAKRGLISPCILRAHPGNSVSDLPALRPLRKRSQREDVEVTWTLAQFIQDNAMTRGRPEFATVVNLVRATDDGGR